MIPYQGQANVAYSIQNGKLIFAQGAVHG